MKLPLQYTFSIIFFFLSAAELYSQDTTAVTVDEGLSLYIDYGKLLTLPFNFETKAEAGIAYRLKNRFSPNLQVGMAMVDPSAAFENGTFTAEGQYARVGLNYIIPLDGINMLYIGGKYAVAMYEESGTYEIGSSLWQNRAESYSRKDLQADWFEFVIGSEKRLKKSSGEPKSDKSKQENSNWSLGGYFSLRIINSREKFEPIDTYAIPGYGRTFDRTVPVLNLYVRYDF